LAVALKTWTVSDSAQITGSSETDSCLS